MAFWNRSSGLPVPAPEHAVLIHLPTLLDGVGLDQIEDPVRFAIDAAGAGEFDGNAIGPDGAILYTYGPDADVLWDAIDAAVRSAPIGPGSYAIKRYGGPGSDELRVDLS